MAQDVENHARELVQTRLLALLFSSEIARPSGVLPELVLKGGLGMRLLAGTHRHTKDIDLDTSTAVACDRVRKRVAAAITKLGKLGGIEGFRVSMPKNTDTVMRWKIGGMVGGTALHLTVEVSRRSEFDPRDLTTKTLADGRRVDCITLERMAAAKMDCLANPQREAPRDIHDLVVLVTLGVRPPRRLIEALGPERLDTLRNDLWSKIEKIDYAVAREKLLPYMPTALAAEIDEARWEEFRITVADTIEMWIREYDAGADVEEPDVECPPPDIAASAPEEARHSMGM